MDTKTVAISSKLISSIPLGIFFTVILLTLLHYFGTWNYNASPDYSNTSMGFATSIYNGIDNHCVGLDKTHYVAFTEAATSTFDIPEIKNLNSLKWKNSLKHSFDNHWTALVLSTFLLSFIIYIFKTVRFQIK